MSTTMRPSILTTALITPLRIVLLITLGCAPTGIASSEAEQRAANTSTASDREANAWFKAGRESVGQAVRFIHGEPPAKNIILFVGDGMGIATVTAARILEGQRRGEPGEENRLSFETLPHVAFSKTYSTDAQVSDSASTMTAIASGVKTLTGVLGIDERARRGDHQSVSGTTVLTILEEAEDRGLATGVVTTTALTHATPAGCYAHVPIRSWQNDSRLSEAARKDDFPDIARQLLEFSHGDGLEVALGGGRRHFLPTSQTDSEYPHESGERLDDRDLTHEWTRKHKGSRYVWNQDQFMTVDPKKTTHLLGLFEPGHMKFEADRIDDSAGEPSLAEMTSLAIDILQNDPDGFFLMVEAGRIDHGHHAGNAYRALSDTIALSDAVRKAFEKTNAEETLIVVTADHSHTLTIVGYPKRGNPILGKVQALRWSDDLEEEQFALDTKKKPYTTLAYSNGPGHTGKMKRPDLTDIDTESRDYRQEATVPLSSETHAGEDVPIYAGGPRAALFHGVQEQNYIYHAMVEAFGWTRAGVPITPGD